MSTRAEQVEACKSQAERLGFRSVFAPIGPKDETIHNRDEQRFRGAAATLTRDGELRERLKKLLLDMEQDCDARSWAQDIEALMKETSDEG